MGLTRVAKYPQIMVEGFQSFFNVFIVKGLIAESFKPFLRK